jgi:hypothetical protein
MIAGLAAILILLAIAGVHFYWAAGGRAGKNAAIPVANSRPVIRPSAFGTAMVGVVLCAMAAWLALRLGLVVLSPLARDGIVIKTGAWLMAAAFALRAIGDFRYVGFFKTIRDSAFARLDTLAYSPLCACLALLIGAATLA